MNLKEYHVWMRIPKTLENDNNEFSYKYIHNDNRYYYIYLVPYDDRYNDDGGVDAQIHFEIIKKKYKNDNNLIVSKKQYLWKWKDYNLTDVKLVNKIYKLYKNDKTLQNNSYNEIGKKCGLINGAKKVRDLYICLWFIKTSM